MASTFDDDEDITFDIKKKLVEEFTDEDPEAKASAADTEKRASTGAVVDEGQMRVYLRVRPLSDTEKLHGEDQNCIKLENDNLLVANAPKDSNTYKNAVHRMGKGSSQKFTFSKIFSETTSQKLFFDEAVLGTVKDFVHGQNCLLFTYGVTNSGKTYTIQGYQNDVGILPRALAVMFNSIGDAQWQGKQLKPVRFCDVMALTPSQEDEERKLKTGLIKLADNEDPDGDMTINMSRLTADSTMSEDSLMIRDSIASCASHRDSEPGELLTSISDNLPEVTRVELDTAGSFKYSMWVSFAEIYNENIHDLLEPLAKRKNTRGRPVLTLRDDKNGTPYVRGLKEIHVTSADEAYKLLTLGRKNLQIACTKLNRNSSRSHCIFTIKLIQIVDTAMPSAARTSMLSFCDLAGSERYTKTQSFGDRIKEAGNINTSLLTLGRCINILRHNQTNKDHPQVVPFRESKLTRMFQSFFCGKGRAAMIVNINMCASTFDETLHALKYSAIAKQIIVVQEPEKPKANARNFSMLLSNSDPRQTIGWATPGTCAKALQEEEEEKDDDDDEVETETEREKELIELLEQMKQKLIEEKKRQLVLEVKIRDEVCKEMAQQLVEIEHHYSERLKREQVHHEEKADRRMEILTQSVLKSRKRQRIFDDDEGEELVSSVLLHAEQAKVQRLEKSLQDTQDELSSLRAETATLRDAATLSGQDRDKLQQENTAVKFKIKDLEKQVLEKSRVDESLNQSCMSEEVGDLATKLSEAESELDTQRQAVTRLQQVIDILQCNAGDAQDKMDAADREVSASKSALSAAQKDLTAHADTISGLEGRLTERDAKIVEMEGHAEKQETVLQELQASLEQISQELEKNQQENEEQDALMVTLRDELSARHAEYETLASQKQSVDDQLRRSLDNRSDALQEAEKQLMECREELAQSQTGNTGHLKELSSCQAELEALRKELVTIQEQSASNKDLVEKEREGLQRQLDEAQSLVLRREEELEALKAGLEGKGEAEEQLKNALEAQNVLRHERDAIKSDLDDALEKQEKLQEQEADLRKELETLTNEKVDLTARLNDKEELLFKTEEAQQELQEEIEDLKTSLKTNILKLDEKHETKMACMEASLEDDFDNLKAQLENEIARVRDELATHQLNMEIKDKQIEALKEASNSRSEELSELQVKLDEKTEECAAVEEKLRALEASNKESQVQLEDYILKVNAQVEQIAQLEIELAENKEASIEELEKLKLQSSEDMELLKDELKELQDLLDQENDKFEKRVSELEAELSEAQQEEKINRNRKEELERKMSGLQMTLDMAEEEQEAQKSDLEKQLSEMRKDLQEKNNHNVELESELEHLKSMANGQEHDKTEAQEEIEQLKKNIRELDQKVNDTEYNHQISCRQLRREKSNIEKLLKAAEETSTELEAKMKELEEQQNQEREELGQKHSDETARHQDRITKLEEVVKDLEICLKSSKDHEAIALTENDNYKTKCRQLESECNLKEDTILSLNDEIDRFREESIMAGNQSNAETNEQMESLRREVMDCKKAYDDLEFEMKDIKEEKILVEMEFETKTKEFELKLQEASNAKEESVMLVEELNKLKEALKSAEHEVEQLQTETCTLKDEISTRSGDSETQLKDLEAQVEEKNVEIGKLQEESNSMESKISSLEEKHSQLQQSFEELKHQNSSVSKDLQSQLIGRSNELTECQNKLDRREKIAEELKKKVQDLQIDLDVASSKLNENNESNSATEEHLKTSQQELAESRSLINKHVEQITELEEQIEKLKTFEGTCNKLESEVKNLQDSKNTLEEDVATKQRHLSGMSELEKRLVDMEDSTSTMITDLKEKLQNETDSKQDLQEKVSELQSKLQLQGTAKIEECTLLQSQVTILEKKLTNMEAVVTETETSKSKINDLEAEFAIVSKQKEKSERLVKTLQEEVDDLEQKSRQRMKKSSENTATLEQEMARVESQLRQKAASAEAERDALTEELARIKKRAAEQEAETDSKNKSDLDALKQTISELEEKLRTTEVSASTLRDEVKHKEHRLKTRNDAMNTFMTKMDAEKEKYDMLLRDHRYNEKVIGNLKEAIEEQEQTMNKQDEVLKGREKDIQQLADDLNEQLERVKTLQDKEEASRQRYKSLREERDGIEKQLSAINTGAAKQQKLDEARDEEFTDLQRAKNRAEDRLATVQTRLEDATVELRDLRTRDRDIGESNRELAEKEKLLKERDHELAAMHRQLTSLQEAEASRESTRPRQESDADSHALTMLKTKFQAREEQVHQLEQEKANWKARAESIEEQKAQELTKWRVERDKLVSKIEEILHVKDAEIDSLKQGHAGTQLVSELRRQLEEKDAQLCASRAATTPTTGKRRRHRSSKTGSGSSEDDAEGLKRQMEGLHSQMDHMRLEHKQELNKVLRAKDTIIEDMRSQNHKLTSQLSTEELHGSHSARPTSAPPPPPSDEEDRSTRTTKRGRSSRKRKSSEHEPAPEEAPVAVVAQPSKRGRKSTKSTSRSTRGKSTGKALAEENLDPALSMISEEGVIDLDEPTPRKALNNSTNILDQTPDTSRGPTFLSPSKDSLTTTAPQKRKKKLKSTVEEPLMDSPLDVPQVIPNTPAQAIVKRKLRSRKK